MFVRPGLSVCGFRIRQIWKCGNMQERNFFSWIGIALTVVCLLAAAHMWFRSEQMLASSPMNEPEFSVTAPVKKEKTVYRFGIHPLHNPQRLFSNFHPVIDMINEDVSDFEVKLIAARNYQSFEERLARREFDIALANPLQALYGIHVGYRIVAKMADDRNFCGLLISRKDSPLHTAADFSGHVLVFPSPSALAATLMPKLFLYEHGTRFEGTQEVYSGSQESAIMNVYLGKADLAGTWPMPWELLLKEYPDMANTLCVHWRTEPLINNAILVRDDLPEEDVEAIVQTLISLSCRLEGGSALAQLSFSSFEIIDNASYEKPVQRFLDAYRKAFPGDKDLLQ